MIGKGSSGTVYLGKQDITNKIVAIKVINLKTITNDYQWKLINQEIESMKKLNSKHIVKLLDVY